MIKSWRMETSAEIAILYSNRRVIYAARAINATARLIIAFFVTSEPMTAPTDSVRFTSAPPSLLLSWSAIALLSSDDRLRMRIMTSWDEFWSLTPESWMTLFSRSILDWSTTSRTWETVTGCLNCMSRIVPPV